MHTSCFRLHLRLLLPRPFALRRAGCHTPWDEVPEVALAGRVEVDAEAARVVDAGSLAVRRRRGSVPHATDHAPISHGRPRVLTAA